MDKKYLRKIEKLGLTFEQSKDAFMGEGRDTMLKIREKMKPDWQVFGNDRYTLEDIKKLKLIQIGKFNEAVPRIVFGTKHCVTKLGTDGAMRIYLDFPYRDKFDAGEVSYLVHELGHYVTKDRSKKTKYERELEATKLQIMFDNQVKDKDSRRYLYALDFANYVLGYYEFRMATIEGNSKEMTQIVNETFKFKYEDIGKIYKQEAPLDLGWYTVCGVCLAELLR